jgi:hypothetical protein
MPEPEGSSLDLSQVRIANTRAYIEQFGEFPYGLDDSRERPPLGSSDEGGSVIFVERVPETEEWVWEETEFAIPEPPTETPNTVEEFLALAEYHERKLEAGRRYRMEQVLDQAARWIMERDEVDYEQARLYVEERLDL